MVRPNIGRENSSKCHLQELIVLEKLGNKYQTAQISTVDEIRE